MFKTRKCFVSVTAAVALGALCAACGLGDTDVEVNAPLLSAAGLNVKETLMGKPAPEPNLQERAPLVMPPPNAPLPVPGQSQAAAHPQWPADSDEARKQAAKDAAAKRDDYCKNGDWKDGKGNIEKFDKNLGKEDRCRADWIYRAMHSGDEKKAQ
jgi:hypothetical protein